MTAIACQNHHHHYMITEQRSKEQTNKIKWVLYIFLRSLAVTCTHIHNSTVAADDDSCNRLVRNPLYLLFNTGPVSGIRGRKEAKENRDAQQNKGRHTMIENRKSRIAASFFTFDFLACLLFAFV